MRADNPVTSELNNGTKRDDGRLKANYFHTFGDKAKVEAGLQANFAYRNIDIASRDYDWNTNQWIINPLAQG